MEIWLTKSIQQMPIVVAIHGGGFKGDDKSKYSGCEELHKCLENGVSFTSINCRFHDEDPRGIISCLQDSKRVIQFIRHHTKE